MGKVENKMHVVTNCTAFNTQKNYLQLNSYVNPHFNQNVWQKEVLIAYQQKHYDIYIII